MAQTSRSSPAIGGAVPTQSELSVHAGQVLSYEHLMQRVWGQTKPGTPRVIRTHLMRLRRKLGEDGDNPKYIFAEPRVGYRMERPDARTGAEE